MNMHQWAQLAGVTMAVVSMLRYDVIGHWWHRWDCLSRPVMKNFGTYYECRVCGKRKVTRPYSGPTEKDMRWMAHEPMTYQPWEMGPPPSPFPKLETRNQSADGIPVTTEQAATNLATYAALSGYTIDDLSTDPEGFARLEEIVLDNPYQPIEHEDNDDVLEEIERTLQEGDPDDAIVHDEDVEIVRLIGDGEAIKTVVLRRDGRS